MISFSQNEKDFLAKMEECRVATSHDDISHVKPVSYLIENDTLLIATDYETRMYKNLQKNRRAALSIDVYAPNKHKAVCIQGNVEIIENGAEFKRIYQKFYDKFDWVRDQPWEENEAPFIKIKPFNKTSWGL